jgi:hypothetical protein
MDVLCSKVGGRGIEEEEKNINDTELTAIIKSTFISRKSKVKLFLCLTN